MGTSTSSTGPGGGVPFVPPWTPPAPPLLPDTQDMDVPADIGAQPSTEEQTPEQELPGNAPAGRFGPTRRALRDYGRSGHRNDLQKALGSYVSRGYGGGRTASRRFSGTAATASALGNVLAALANSTPIPGLDRSLLATMDVDTLLDTLVEVVRQVDGTQDAEAERRSTREAMTDTLKKFPEADPLNLDATTRAYAIERFVALDVFNRFFLDVGAAIQDNAPNPTQALARLAEAKAYIAETVSAAFRRLEQAGHSTNTDAVSRVIRTALRDAFEIFEDYTG